MLVVGLLVGCSSLPDTHFYIITSDVNEAVRDKEIYSPVLGIGRIHTADYLHSRGIITQTDDFRIHTATYHRWAEPLQAGIRRKIAQQLSQATEGIRIEARPANFRDTDYRLDIEIGQFHSSTTGAVVLHGRWTLYDVERGTLLDSTAFALEEMMVGSGYQSAVKAKTDLLARLGARISAAINGITKNPV